MAPGSVAIGLEYAVCVVQQANWRAHADLEHRRRCSDAQLRIVVKRPKEMEQTSVVVCVQEEE